MTADNGPGLALLRPGDPFPPPDCAWGAESPAPGLLAAGGALDVPTLVAAYRQTIFPWFSEGEPILWWSPDPRMVLDVREFRLHRSLRKTLARFVAGEPLHESARAGAPGFGMGCTGCTSAAIPGGIASICNEADRPDTGCASRDGFVQRFPNSSCEIRIDSAFERVMAHCAAAPRAGQPGTWIVPPMQRAYAALHRAGHAHSVETWINGQLAAGLYCVALGRAVFGESMFTTVSDGSKIALCALIALCRAHGMPLIDCQQNTPHLAFMGARERPRAWFVAQVEQLAAQPAPIWHAGTLNPIYWKTLFPQTLSSS